MKYKPDLLIALQWLPELTTEFCEALHDLTLPPITSVNTFSTLPSPSLCSNHTVHYSEHSEPLPQVLCLEVSSQRIPHS